MNVVIIEDEVYAARRLENMIKEVNPNIKILAKLESISESVLWFNSNNEPDLIFLDINLDDGLSFSIFNSISICSHIVFTTATDELAIRAFNIRKIDYLLKPIIQDDLKAMIEKYSKIPKSSSPMNPEMFNDIINNRIE